MISAAPGENSSAKEYISDKEYADVYSILKSYSIEPASIEKIRGVYRIDGNGKLYSLKKIRHSKYKAYKGYILSDYLKRRGFNNVITYILNKKNEIGVNKGKYLYYITEWINGSEADLNSLDDLKRCAVLLGNFHNAAEGCRFGRFAGERSKDWLQEMGKKRRDIEAFKRSIESLPSRCSFDSEYYKEADSYIERMDEALGLLSEDMFRKLTIKAFSDRQVCHDSFYYQNIISGDDSNLYIIDLDSAVYGLSCYDLAKFIRRMLFKSEYAWKFSAAENIISEYRKIRDLSYEEICAMLSFIIFPHKFWKLGKKRYIKDKNWSDFRYENKLYKVVRYKDEIVQFMKDYKEFYEIK
jgi:CotS family spore coat protein